MSKSLSIRPTEHGAILRDTVILSVGLGIFQGIAWMISSPLYFWPFSSAFLALVAPLVWAIAFFIHGIFVGKRTGKNEQTALIGLFGGIFGGFTAAVGHIFVLALSLGYTSSDQLLSIGWGVVGFTLETLFFTLVAGVIFGFLGGFIGKYLSPAVAQPKSSATSKLPMYYYPPVLQVPQVPQPNLPGPQPSPSAPQA